MLIAHPLSQKLLSCYKAVSSNAMGKTKENRNVSCHLHHISSAKHGYLSRQYRKQMWLRLQMTLLWRFWGALEDPRMLLQGPQGLHPLTSLEKQL